MGRKLLIIAASFLFLLGLFTSLTLAQEASQTVESSEGIAAPDIILPPPQPRPFLGQDHSYSVVFRGNGEGVVSVRVVLTNKGDDPLSNIFLRIPKVEPKNLSVYQVIRERSCIRYGPQVYDQETRSYKVGPCLQYQDSDYYSNYGSPKYQKTESEFKGDTLSITLPQPIAPDKSGSYFVYFRAFGYAKKNIFGAYKFTFESLKAEDDIRSLQVGISTDSDLVLKGAKGEVQYRFEADTLASLEKTALGAPAASTAVDTFYRNIGQGRITKTASNLAPLESYTVTGAYAKNRLKLYAKEISIGLSVVIVLLAVAVIVVRFVFRKISRLGQRPQAKEKAGLPENTLLGLAAAGLGLVSSLLIVGYTALVIFLGVLLTSLVSYRYDAVLILFLVLISFSVYILLLFGPALYFGVKKGIGWGIATVISTVLWLILFLGLAAIIILLLGRGGTPSPIRPLPLLEGLSR